MPSAKDIREFRGFLRNASDRQVQGIYDKEKSAGRDEYAELAVEEAERRGIELDQIGHSTKKKSRAQLDREIAAVLKGQRGTKSRQAASRSNHATKRNLPPLKRISTTAGDFDAYLAVHRDPMNDREFRLSWYELDGTGSIPERGLTQNGFRSEAAARAYAQATYKGDPIRTPAYGVGPDLRKKVQRAPSTR